MITIRAPRPWARKLRTILTGVRDRARVATISGTFVLTDSITHAFDTIFTTIYEGTDASITGKSAFERGQRRPTCRRSTSRCSTKVKALPDVQAAVGGVGDDAHLIGKNGKVISFGGAPNLGFSVDPSQPEFNSLTLVQGAWPGNDEVVVDRSTAGKKHIEVGDQIRIEAQGAATPFKVAGLVKFGSSGLNIGGATLAGFNLPTAQRLFEKEGKLDQIRVSRQARRQRGCAARPDPVDPAPADPGAQRRRRRRTTDASDTRRLHELPADVPALVRLHRALRRRVRDRQLALDHDRAADTRVRDAADDRGVAASDPPLGPARVVRDRHARLDHGSVPRARARQAALLALRAGRASRSRTPACSSSRARSIVSLIVGILVTMIARLRPALRATRVPPIAAVREGATLPPGRFARFRADGLGATRRARLRCCSRSGSSARTARPTCCSSWESAPCSSSSASRSSPHS